MPVVHGVDVGAGENQRRDALEIGGSSAGGVESRSAVHVAGVYVCVVGEQKACDGVVPRVVQRGLAGTVATVHVGFVAEKRLDRLSVGSHRSPGKSAAVAGVCRVGFGGGAFQAFVQVEVQYPKDDFVDDGELATLEIVGRAEEIDQCLLGGLGLEVPEDTVPCNVDWSAVLAALVEWICSRI